MRFLFYLLLAILFVLGISFAIQNAEPVTIHFLGDKTLPLSMLLVIALGVGIVVGMSFFLLVYLRLQKRIYQLKHQLKIAVKEVENLRAIPLKDDV